MKNFALAVLGLSFAVLNLPPLAPGSRAETLDTVTFNPARLGQFERVKISDALNAPGGVKAQSVAVQSGGSVDVNNAGAYDISLTQVKGSANLPDTELYSPSVNAKGGSVSFDDTAKSSNVGNLTTAPNLLKLKANALKMSSLKVTGEGGQIYGGESLTGLKLGGNEIKPGNNCKGLQWVKRTASDDNVYQVLAMGTCGDGGDACKTVYGNQEPYDAVTDTCPGNDSLNMYGCSGGFKGQCIDVFGVSGTSDNEKQTSDSLASFVDPDNCDGDVWNQYTCSAADVSAKKSCYDIYLSNKNNMGSIYKHAGKCLPYSGAPFTYNYGCSFYGMTQLDYSEGLAEISAHPSAKCLRLIQGYSKGGVGGKCTFNSSTDRCAYPQYGGYYFLYLSCNPRYVREKVYCGGKGVPYRKVICCGNENDTSIPVPPLP